MVSIAFCPQPATQMNAKKSKTSTNPSAKTSRRAFLRRTVITGAGLLILPNSRSAFGYEANSKLSVAAIGIAGRGRGNTSGLAKAGANIAALCDVDHDHAAQDFKQYPDARAFKDFRRMFDQMEKSIDAVIVSTPDHTHAVAVAAAINRGKHIYCEKPLTRTVREARTLRELARKHKVVTQMGNQGSSSNGLRRAVELAWAGTVGEIREAYLWFGGGNRLVTRPTDRPPVPPGLDWDLWLGPAEERPYSPEYLPEKWRDWRAFGSGKIGDFGCHTGNLMFRALKLERLWNSQESAHAKRCVIRVESEVSERSEEGYPTVMRTVVELPARGELPPVKLAVHLGSAPSAELMPGYPQGKWGDLLVGSKGSVYSDNPWNTSFVLLPEERFENVKHGPPQTIP